MGRPPGRRERGAASTEALILLPFFFIVWGCLFFTYSRLEKEVVVNEIARTCAWQHMSGSCQQPQSPRCSFSGAPQLADADLEGANGSLGNFDSRMGDFALSFRGMFGPVFRPIFGTQRESQVQRPRTIGGGQVGVATDFSEMCNEIPGDETVPSVARTSYCAVTGWCN